MGRTKSIILIVPKKKTMKKTFVNLVEEYVTNITHISEPNEYGCRKVTADYNCYGNKQMQVTKMLHIRDIEMIKEKGYYLT